MKLFAQTQDQVVKVSLSAEQFVAYHKTGEVFSMEAVSDYLYKVKDMFDNAKKRIIEDSDKLGIDAQASKFELENVIKRIKFIDAKDYAVQKPENFKGKYVDYLQDIIKVSTDLVPSTIKTVNTLKLTIASFINEYKEDEVFTLYGGSSYKEAAKVTEKTVDTLKGYFKDNSTAVKANIGDLLKTFNDIPTIHKQIESISKLITLDTVKNINKIADEASSLIDSLIEQNLKSGVLVKNESSKKELVEALYTTGKMVETVSYVYSNVIHFYASYNDMTRQLFVLGDKV